MKRKPLTAIAASWEGHARSARLVQACLGLAMLVQLAACSGSVVLDASETAQDCKAASGKNEFPLLSCMETHGKACDTSINNKTAKVGAMTDLQKAAPLVGWTALWDPGTQPAACWEWVSNATRAYVNFDIFPALQGKSEKIISATLKWSASTDEKWSGLATGALTSVCYGALFEATGAWKSFDTPGDFLNDWSYPTTAAGNHAIDVTKIIRKWAKGDQQYFGFFFTAAREDLPHGSSVNGQCLTTLDSVRLEVLHAK